MGIWAWFGLILAATGLIVINAIGWPRVPARGQVGAEAGLVTVCIPARNEEAHVAACLDAALAQGPGGEVRQPMAVAVVGGVLVSTLLTLFVVPALYSLFDALTSRIVTSGAHEREAAKAIAELDLEEVARAAQRAETGGRDAAAPGAPAGGRHDPPGT